VPGNFLYPEAGLPAETLIRFALSLDIDRIIVGCSTPDEAELLARFGREKTPMDGEEQERLVEAVRPYAERLAYYRGVF
jgi:hypothetical protein